MLLPREPAPASAGSICTAVTELKSLANCKFIYLFIYFEKWERGRERASAWARELGAKNRLESANISHAHLTTPCAGLGRGKSVEFSFDYLLDSCEQWVNVQEPCDHRRWQAVGFEAGRAHWLSFGTAHQPVCQHNPADGEQRGEEPPWEVAAGGRTSYKMLLEEGNVCHQLLRSANLLYFLQRPKGWKLKPNGFDNLADFFIIIF